MAEEQEIMELSSETQVKEERNQVSTGNGSYLISVDQLQQMEDERIAAAELEQESQSQHVEEIFGGEGESKQEGMVVEHQEGDPNGEAETQEIYLDGDGNILAAQMPEKVTYYYSMDPEGKLIPGTSSQESAAMTTQVGIQM